MKTPSLDLRLWRLQRSSALVLLPLVAFHILYQYFLIGPDAISHSAVSARLNMALFLIIDILLLLSVVTHSFLGLRSIVMDYASSSSSQRNGTAIILAVLGITTLFGLAALFAFL